MNNAKSISHEEATVRSLRNDPDFAIEYLNAVLEDGDAKEILAALRRIAEAWMGISKLAVRAKLNEKSLHRSLSEEGNPTLKSLLSINRALGLSVSVRKVELSEEEEIPYAEYPIREMMKRGWLRLCNSPARVAPELFKELFDRLGITDSRQMAVAFRTSQVKREGDTYALQAWLWGAMLAAHDVIDEGFPAYDDQVVTKDFLHEVAQLSRKPNYGFEDAVRVLREKGIAFVVVPHLKKTYLDGAVFFYKATPVIAMTLRYDRLDSFWFTLLHELAHLSLGHVKRDGDFILDNLYSREEREEVEKDADKLASDAEIPADVWRAYKKDLCLGKIATIYEVADKLCIHNAIVAGRIRHEMGRWNLLAQHVGNGVVRKAFPKEFPEKA